jgi:hypothetical protein
VVTRCVAIGTLSASIWTQTTTQAGANGGGQTGHELRRVVAAPGGELMSAEGWLGLAVVVVMSVVTVWGILAEKAPRSTFWEGWSRGGSRNDLGL